jgi:hypothetical protein
VSLESSIRAMLINGTTINLVPDSRVTHGYRLQDSALPAITFEVTSDERATVKATQRKCEIEVRSIAVEAVDALAIAAQVRTAITTGTFDGMSFKAAIFSGTILQQPAVGEGDEAEPAEAVTTATIYYEE